MDEDAPGEGMSWGAMLAIIAAAILVAGVIAYQIVAPFFAGQR
jgi:hypothetical protein